VHALVGENGAGKSTLVKIISGAEGFDSGTLEIAGQPLERLTPGSARHLGIACLYQQPALFPDLTVAENIALRLEPAAAFRRIDWSARGTRATELLEQVGAKISTKAEVRDLSMPEQQLVEIACAVGSGARIVLMDEPTSSLTQKEQHLLFAVIRGLRRRGVGIVYISHRLEEVFALADRVTVLRDAETVASGSIEDFDESSLIHSMVGRQISDLYPDSAGEAGDTACSLQGVGCSFSGIHDVCLDWRKGEVLGIAGLVGAGRTELARILFGITPADAGSIILNGSPVTIRSPQDALALGIAYVPEDRRHQGVIPELPIEQNITLAIHRRLFRYTWLNPKAERELTLKMIRDLGVKTPSPDAPVSSLSGGNQQKVVIAREMGRPFDILLASQPTRGVDVGAIEFIHSRLREARAAGKAILLVSAELKEVLALSDRVAVMYRGKLTKVIPASEANEEVLGEYMTGTKTENAA